VAYARLPLSFEVNEGQTHEDVKFLSRGSGFTLFLTSNEMVLSLRQPVSPGTRIKAPGSEDGMKPDPKVMTSHSSLRNPDVQNSTLHITLSGANPKPTIEGLDTRPGKSNYFIGNDPKKWRVDVPAYAKVRYQSVYPGVDVVYYGSDGQLETDFVIAPGVDPSVIKLRFKGATKTRIDSNGDVLVDVGDADLRFRKPTVYQYIRGARHEVASHYRLKSRDQAGFQLEAYDRTQPLIIDPVLVYSTYLGGTNQDFATGIAVDSAGNAYICGYTNSANFPITPGAFQHGLNGGQDAFVLKLNSAGTAIVYSTYLGGSSGDTGYAIAVDAAGNAYLAGETVSSDFPTTPGAFRTTPPSGDTGFAAKLNATGSALIYSTYLGGSGRDYAQGIAIDGSGNAYVMGVTASSDFPTTLGAFQTVFGGGGGDAYLSKLNPAGSALVYSTYLGGSGSEGSYNGIAVDASGNAYLAGSTQSTNFPTTPGAFQTVFAGGSTNGFVAKLNPTGSALVYSTYVGGTTGENVLQGIAIDGAGNVYSTFYTGATDFPVTPGAFQTASGGYYDAGAIKLNQSGSALAYSTYLGGSAFDGGVGIAVDGSGNATVFGSTQSSNFPVTIDAFQSTFGGGTQDTFVTTLNANGSGVIYSSYLGGSGDDRPSGIAEDTSGNVYLAGSTASSNFPTVNPLQPANAGGFDVFVTKIGFPPVYVAAVQQPINADGSSVFNANRGVIPVKFTLTANGVSTCTLPPATISLFRTAGSVIGAIDESVYEMSADTGSNFRISGCQYIYNLSAKPLGTGTYRIDISIGSSVVGSAVFALK
jgi:Beta-propeller repeat